MCACLRSKTVNCTQDADKELWCIEEDEDSPVCTPKRSSGVGRQMVVNMGALRSEGGMRKWVATKEWEREQARERKKNQRERMKLMQAAQEASGAPEVWMDECVRLLSRLMRHQHAWPFNAPVDPVALKLPDYHDVVQTPMDLGTVQERLQEKAYTHAKEFVRDVMLTFDNALDYNPTDNFVYKHAESVMGYFKTLLKNSRILCHKLSIPVGGNSRSSGSSSGKNSSSNSGALRAVHRGDRVGARSLLDSWRSARASTTRAPASARYSNSHNVRDGSGRFVKKADREAQPPTNGNKGSRDQRHEHSGLRLRDPPRAPKRRLDTDQHGRSIMPLLKRPHLNACNGQLGDGGSNAAKRAAEEPQDCADADSLR